MSKPRDAAAVRLFPPAVPLVAVLAGVALNRYWPLAAGGALPAPMRYWVGGTIIAASILVLGLWPVLLFRLGGQSENPWSPTLHIVDRGPYRVTRNPMYLQMVLVCVGFAILLANAWVLLLTPVAACVLQRWAIRPEEAYLEKKFGAPYRDYKERVRRWI